MKANVAVGLSPFVGAHLTCVAVESTDFRAFISIPRIRADLRLVPKEGILESPDDPQVSTKNKPFSESTADKEVETSAPRRGIGGYP